MATLKDVIAVARLGVPVFPLRPGTKDGYVNDASDHGATTDGSTIHDWFRPGGQFEGYNFGCWGGGCFVYIDIDAEHGGLEAWAELEKELGVKRLRRIDQDRRRRVDHPLGCGDAAPRLEARSAA